jgi:hypothetical protein
MSARGFVRLVGAALMAAAAAPSAFGYIHFPPMTLQKMCKTSTHIRVLTVQKYDPEKGVIFFEAVEHLKGVDSPGMTFRHVIRSKAESVKPILDWVGEKKLAVMCSIEGGGIACGYVFIDDYCYSVDYNRAGKFWVLIRAEPDLSACYHGPAAQLHRLAKDVLAGKDVKVPVKKPASPQSRAEWEKRYQEVNDVLKVNRSK